VRRVTNERRDDGPEIVICPSEAHDDEELPLIGSHSNLLNLEAVSNTVT
jgi:hypothetical protein